MSKRDMAKIDIRRLDFSLLLVFLELYRHRRGTEAARKLGLTQSTISHALARLRQIFGDELFLRRSNGLEPTARAVALEPRIRAVVEAAGQLLVAEGDFDPAASEALLRIGGSDYGCAVLGPPLAARLRQVAPGITMTLRPFTRQAAYEALASGELDLAIGYFWRSMPGIEIEPLYEETYSVLVRDGHVLTRGRLRPRVFADASHVLVSHEGDALGIVDRALEPFGLTRRVVATVPYFFAAMAIVRSTDLITTVPNRIANAHATDFGLAALPPPVPIRPFQVALAWHERSKGSAARVWASNEIRTLLATDLTATGSNSLR
jgi:DNA-binding transcriptional LysR family regulator